MKKTTLILSIVIFLSGCGIFNQVNSAYTLSQCKYSYKSLNNIQLAGLHLSDAGSLSISNLASIATILAGGKQQTIPLSMTLALNVKNPNNAIAALNGLEYAIEVENMEFTTGKLNVPLNINPGETKILSLNIGMDLKSLMNRYSQERVAGEMSSFLGISGNPTNITVKLWPTLMIGNTPFKSPTYIPVRFSFGGK